jgi:hypothetical protein
MSLVRITLCAAIDLERFLRIQILTERSKISVNERLRRLSSAKESIRAYYYGNQFTREPKYYMLCVSLKDLVAIAEYINFAIALMRAPFSRQHFYLNVLQCLHNIKCRTALFLLASMLCLLFNSNNCTFLPIRKSFGG